MIRYIIFSLAFIFIACSTQRVNSAQETSKIIVYLLPYSVEKKLKERIDNSIESGVPNTFYYVFGKVGDYEYRIYQDIIIPLRENVLLKNTNRYLSIHGKLYPLIFDTDEDFAIYEDISAEDFINNYKTGTISYTRKSVIRDAVYHINFNFKGEILFEGM